MFAESSTRLGVLVKKTWLARLNHADDNSLYFDEIRPQVQQTSSNFEISLLTFLRTFSKAMLMNFAGQGAPNAKQLMEIADFEDPGCTQIL